MTKTMASRTASIIFNAVVLIFMKITCIFISVSTTDSFLSLANAHAYVYGVSSVVTWNTVLGLAP